MKVSDNGLVVGVLGILIAILGGLGPDWRIVITGVAFSLFGFGLAALCEWLASGLGEEADWDRDPLNDEVRE